MQSTYNVRFLKIGNIEVLPAEIPLWHVMASK